MQPEGSSTESLAISSPGGVTGGVAAAGSLAGGGEGEPDVELREAAAAGAAAGAGAVYYGFRLKKQL